MHLNEMSRSCAVALGILLGILATMLCAAPCSLAAEAGTAPDTASTTSAETAPEPSLPTPPGRHKANPRIVLDGVPTFAFQDDCIQILIGLVSARPAPESPHERVHTPRQAVVEITGPGNAGPTQHTVLVPPYEERSAHVPFALQCAALVHGAVLKIRARYGDGDPESQA